MIRSEERSVSVLASDGLSIEGLVRVRHFRAARGAWRVRMEQCEPVAIVVRRAAQTERVALPKTPMPHSFLMLIAMPVAARIAMKLLTRR